MGGLFATRYSPPPHETVGFPHRCPPNLPGNWESSKFNPPASPVEAVPEIGDHDAVVLMHNDGVAEGLSGVPFMQDVERLGRAHHRFRIG
jgi:hypothetical protein